MAQKQLKELPSISKVLLECSGYKHLNSKYLSYIIKNELVVFRKLAIKGKLHLERAGIVNEILLTIDQLNLLKYDNIASKKYKTNFEINMKANKKFDEEINRYSYNWTSGGQFSKNNKNKNY